jgi:hypothetical protein
MNSRLAIGKLIEAFVRAHGQLNLADLARKAALVPNLHKIVSQK